MKVIFLDVDGVLNCGRTAVAFGGYPWPGEAGDILWPERQDTAAIGLIRAVCRSTHSKVVLSSTWRLGWSKNECAEYGHRLDLPIIDRTTQLPTGPRGAEIKAWLESNPGVERFAIVDDNSDMLPEQMANFVKTCERNGFSFENYQQLIHILGTHVPVSR
jgi:hypothetical protein